MSTVYVCPTADRECGARPAGWCATCPKKANVSTAEEVSRIMALAGDFRNAKFASKRHDETSAALESAITALVERAEAAEKDAERLDWLDAKNKPFRMGWRVGQAPAGCVTVAPVINLATGPTPIRAAIDAARQGTSHE